MKALVAAALAAAVLIPAAPAEAAPSYGQRDIVRVIMLGYLRDHRDVRHEVCRVFDIDPPSAYRMLWQTRISGIRQVVVRRGTRDAIDWACS